MRLLRVFAVALAASGILAFSLWMLSAPAQAAGTGIAPALNAYDARCFRTIQAADDLLCILRYQLPMSTSTTVVAPEAWCAQLVDTTGCDKNPPAPTAPTSLTANVAWLTLCRLTGTQKGCLTDSGTMYLQRAVPRIWHSVGGIYFNAGHGVTWADANVQMCVESGTSFATTTASCIPVSFNTEDNTQDAQRAKLTTDIVAMMTDVESQRSLAKNSYVTNSKLTTAGRTLALEAYNNMDRVIPSAFQAASLPTNLTPFSLTATPAALQTRLNATATAAAWGNFSAAGSQLLGVSGGTFATLFFLGLGLIVAAVVFRTTDGNIPLSIAALGTVSLLGMFVGGPTVSAVAVTIVCFAVPAGWFILRRVPTL